MTTLDSPPATDAVSGFHELTVASVTPLTADSVSVTFTVPAGLRDAFAFSPGQHLTLRREIAGVDVRRTYSLCSSAAASAADGTVSVAVKRIEAGVFSGFACDTLRPGDTVEVLPPAGRFGLTQDPARARRVGLVGAGSGITPLMSIAATVLETEPGSEVVLLYGNRTSREVMFSDALADLKDRWPSRLQVVHVLSRESHGSELLSGRIDAERLPRLLAAFAPVDDVDVWFLCGPLGMVTDAQQVLTAAGAAEVHAELFHAEPPPPRPARPAGAPGRHATVHATLHGRTTTLEVDPDGDPVLDAVLAVRADAPWACRGGVCGTCRARVTEGTVEMAVNYALEPDELASGVVLTCQARPTSDTVSLEFL